MFELFISVTFIANIPIFLVKPPHIFKYCVLKTTKFGLNYFFKDFLVSDCEIDRRCFNPVMPSSKMSCFSPVIFLPFVIIFLPFVVKHSWHLLSLYCKGSYMRKLVSPSSISSIFTSVSLTTGITLYGNELSEVDSNILR